MKSAAKLGHALATDLTTVPTEHDRRSHLTRSALQSSREVKLGTMGTRAPHRLKLGKSGALEEQQRQLPE
jgi:hypothetical protein